MIRRDHKQDHQTDLPLEIQVLNISVNMGRVANWAGSSYISKRHIELIKMFMDQTESFLNDLFLQEVSKRFRPTLNHFKKEFDKLRNESIQEQNNLIWAEKALTWANILQHRAKLA